MAKRKANPIQARLNQSVRIIGAQTENLRIIIDREIAKGKNVRVAIETAWRESGFNDKLTDDLVESIAFSIKTGAGKATLGLEGLRPWILHKYFDAEGLTLSSKIYNTQVDMKKIIAEEIRSNLKAGASWKKVAQAVDDTGLVKGDIAGHIQKLAAAGRKVLSGDPEAVSEMQTLLKRSQKEIEKLAQAGAPTGRLKSAYQNVINQVDRQSEEGITKAVERATNAKARYNAERLSRTEMAAAYKEGFNVRLAEDQDAVAYRSILSSRHTHYDICDFMATADLHGAGAGVWPKGKGPKYPYHPHCTCILQPVYRGSPSAREDTKEAQDYLGGLDREKRVALMGVGGADRFENAPDEWRGLIGFQVESKKPKAPL